MNLDSLTARLRRLRGDTFVRSQTEQLTRSLDAIRSQIERLDARLADAGAPRPLPEPVAEPTPAEKVTVANRRYVDDVLLTYEKFAADWLAAEKPWFTLGATAWLETHLRHTDSVFEYGAGRSTVWWCKHAREVITLEASPYWMSYLNFYLAERRPRYLAKLQMIHVPADWNPTAPEGFKRYWGYRRGHLDDDVIADLERRYVSVDPGPTSVVAFDGSIRSLTMARWALDGRGGQGAEIIVVDNTEDGVMSSLGARIAEGYVRLDFAAGPDDDIPEGQLGRHVTTVFVSEERMATCERGGALPEGTDLAPHQVTPELSPDNLRRRLAEYRDRLVEIGAFQS